MRLCVAYGLLVVASVIITPSAGAARPNSAYSANPKEVLDPKGRQIGHTRKITKPSSSGGGTIPATGVTDPAATNQTITAEKTVVSTTEPPVNSSTSTPYALSVDVASTPETRSEVSTTPNPKNDIYFKPPDIMSLFATTTTTTTTPKVTVEEAEDKTPKAVAVPTSPSSPDVERKVVTEKANILPATHDADVFDRKEGKKEQTQTTSIYYVEPTTPKKGGKKRDKASVPEGNTQTQSKGGNSEVDAKRVYDSVLKAFNSAKKGSYFSHDELQKAFPKCKIMY